MARYGKFSSIGEGERKEERSEMTDRGLNIGLISGYSTQTVL
jgi:hypothetical protein